MNTDRNRSLAQLIVILVLMITGLIYFQVEKEKTDNTPLFQAGDCVIIKSELNGTEWQKPNPLVEKIVDVGNHSYRACFLKVLDECISDYSRGRAIEFEDQEHYTKYDCNGPQKSI